MNNPDVMNSCDTLAERIGLAALNVVERTVVLVSRINFEVELGGLDSFYYNSAGNEAVATVTALNSIGATRAANALEAANALFQDGVPPREREERLAALEGVRELPACPLGALDREFNQDEVFTRLCAFIEAHAEQLQAHGSASE